MRGAVSIALAYNQVSLNALFCLYFFFLHNDNYVLMKICGSKVLVTILNYYKVVQS